VTASDDLIRAWLVPATLRVDVSVDAVLRIHNVGDRPCTNLILEFELPQAFTLEQGRRLIQPRRLGSGQWHDHRIRLRAREPGPCSVVFVNFSFKDGTGRSQRYHDRTIDIDVQTAEVQSEPSGQPTKAPPPRPSPARLARSIFINYRRDDTRWHASRLAECLRRHFPGQVFLDRPLIQPGEDFWYRLNAELQSCAVLLALIGPQWLTVTTLTGERRIDADNDPVRHEIAVALKRGILVIPVLFDTMMPAAEELPHDIRTLANRQSHILDDVRFNTSALEIVFAIRRAIPPST
jgi:hypothetical protein